MNTDDILGALQPVVEALIQARIPYCVGGSVASSAHGLPRATLDISDGQHTRRQIVALNAHRLAGEAARRRVAARLEGSAPDPPALQC